MEDKVVIDVVEYLRQNDFLIGAPSREGGYCYIESQEVPLFINDNIQWEANRLGVNKDDVMLWLEYRSGNTDIVPFLRCVAKTANRNQCQHIDIATAHKMRYMYIREFINYYRTHIKDNYYCWQHSRLGGNISFA